MFPASNCAKVLAMVGGPGIPAFPLGAHLATQRGLAVRTQMHRSLAGAMATVRLDDDSRHVLRLPAPQT